MFVYGIFSSRPQPRILTELEFEHGDVRVGDLVPMDGGCPRIEGDECTLVGGHRSVVWCYKGSLYYRVVA